MRRFMVHFVTEIDFVDGDEASEDVIRIARSISRRQFRRRPRAFLAPDDQGRPGRECGGRRNKG
jgi:hypothetical protein